MINTNYEKAISIHEETLSLTKTLNPKILKKVFSKENNQETAIIFMDENSSYEKTQTINSVELFVLEGIYTNEFGSFKKGSYLKLPKEQEQFIQSKQGCKIFKKTNYPQITQEQILIESEKESWLQGQGNLEVIPLSTQTALVKWPKNERFIPHSHFGGEEIFVLSGRFIDEHGEYQKGTWIRNPHLSHHFPYVEEETIIFVKTGHM